ncbi:choice-of-anchor P family protein [Microbispora sp. NPDC049125]|uniref:choice-of-anchor P family protein n=1 Tax=Microbispora sp. NPDC049125 TaxID=3154929 RepID=UPI003467B63A
MLNVHARGLLPGAFRHAMTGTLAGTLTCAAALSLAATPATAVPGRPGTPQPPTVVFAETFENGQGATPILVTGYTGAAPVNETYTADPAWLANCNGWIVSQQGPPAAPPTSGCGGWWTSVKQLAGSLGKWAGADPATNHAVTGYTNADPGAGKTQLQTVTPVNIGATKRFLTFSVDAAEVNCHGNHAKLGFYLLDGATAVPTFTTPIEPCADSQTTIDGIKVGTYTSDKPVLFNGSTIGLRLVNFQGSGYGNDAAFDNVRILDATPRLGVGFGPASAEIGQTATLTFTVTNTSELAVKEGWSFTANLPSGLKLAAGAPVTDCAAATVTAPAGGAQVGVTGTLAAGKPFCTATVKVTAARAGTYDICAGDVTSRAGIDPPGCAEVRFTPPALIFDAHAHGGRVSSPVLTVAPLVPSDVTCTGAPGADDGTLVQAALGSLGSLGVVTTRASGTVDAAGLRTAAASAKTAHVSLLGGVVTADEVTATATAKDDDTGAVHASGGVSLTNLKVNGVPVVDPGVNLSIDIPLVGKVVINERVATAGGRGISVNAVHVRTLAGVDIVVSHARAALTPPGGPCPTA